MMGLGEEIFSGVFGMGGMVGWCGDGNEELKLEGKGIIGGGYKNVLEEVG